MGYIAQKTTDDGVRKFSLDSSKVKKFAGLALLAAKGDFQLSEFRASHKNYLERVLTPK